MREILYKAKSTADGRWVYGTPNQSSLGNWFIFEGDVSEHVDPDTICQYTGVIAKGARDIYEGDIMIFTDMKGRTHSGPIVFWNGCFCLHHEELGLRIPLADHRNIGSWSVAGNIHDQQ